MRREINQANKSVLFSEDYLEDFKSLKFVSNVILLVGARRWALVSCDGRKDLRMGGWAWQISSGPLLGNQLYTTRRDGGHRVCCV
jgi:hypothetical protein